MENAIQRYFGLAAVMVGCVGGVACESEKLSEPGSEALPGAPAAAVEEGLNAPAAPISAEKRAAFELENSKIRCREGVSGGELSVRWEKTSEVSRAELKAVLKNNGSASISAEPVLMAANPSLAEARERRLEPVTVAPGAEATVIVNVADFPMQSVGEATSVSIGLRWKRQDMQAEMVSPQAISEPLFVTHDDASFRTAVVREQESELARQLATTTKAQPVERRLRRALAPTGVGRFEMIERLDAPSSGASSLALNPATEIEGRQP